MKHTLLALIMAVTCMSAAKGQRGYNRNTNGRMSSDCPPFYMGISSGLENPGGLLGFDLELPVNNVGIGAGIGLISMWGTKYYVQGRYYFKPCLSGWAVGLGASYSSGGKDVVLKNQRTDIGTHDITLDLKPQANIYLTVAHYFRIGPKTRFFLGSGFSTRITDNGLYTMKSPFVFDANGEQAMRTLAPGGLMFDLGFSFGI